MNVSVCDSRNFFLWDYLKLAIPSYFFIIIVWSLYDIMTIVAGLLSIREQDSYVILMNIMYFMYMISQGIQSASVSLIGNQIG